LVKCQSGQKCDPGTGNCVNNYNCDLVKCQSGQKCDPGTGNCVNNYDLVKCPPYTCSSDNCPLPQTCVSNVCTPPSGPSGPSGGFSCTGNICTPYTCSVSNNRIM